MDQTISMQQYYENRFQAIERRLAAFESARAGITALDAVTLKSQAAQQQAQGNLYAPLRNDTRAVLDLAAFARRLLDPMDLGFAVSEEVKEAARKALGLE
jgi:hypothetical protein